MPILILFHLFQTQINYCLNLNLHYLLLLFLQKNPTVKIEIQGHANGPKRKNLKEFRKLSENRAEAIKKYLTFEGISKKRLAVEGFGNAMMLFPNPQTEEESELNRRVEIKIISVNKIFIFKITLFVLLYKHFECQTFSSIVAN